MNEKKVAKSKRQILSKIMRQVCPENDLIFQSQTYIALTIQLVLQL